MTEPFTGSADRAENSAVESELEAVHQLFAQAQTELGKVLVGQQELLQQAVVTVLAGGHALLEGVPGVAKTLAVKTLARWLGLEYRRVQGTPDMMPADITGTSVFVPSSGDFRFHPGPAFTQFLLADEINRMPPRTQAALLECMEERQITAEGTAYPLDPLFTVFATQNPVEFEGTYPLPEAQLDRFLLKIVVPYPSAVEELLILQRHNNTGGALQDIQLQPVSPELVRRAREACRGVRMEPHLLEYLLALVRRTREWPTLTLGASPRAAVSLLAVSKAYAALDGRSYLLPDDIRLAMLPTLRHRVQLRPEAELEGMDPNGVLRDIIAALPLPR
ncbi:MAG: AAA family ATPase [Janthinobacterium lividum]